MEIEIHTVHACESGSYLFSSASDQIVVLRYLLPLKTVHSEVILVWVNLSVVHWTRFVSSVGNTLLVPMQWWIQDFP